MVQLSTDFWEGPVWEGGAVRLWCLSLALCLFTLLGVARGDSGLSGGWERFCRFRVFDDDDDG